MVSVRRIRAGGGLSTDPTALDQPEGLRVADNVLLHRPGTIQPRPGFGDTAGIPARNTPQRPIAIVPFDGDLVVQSVDDTTYRLARASTGTEYGGALAPPDASLRGSSDHATARGSLYLTSSAGVRKLADVADAAHVRAGARTDYVDVVTEGKSALASDEPWLDRYAVGSDSAVAYRYCWVSEDGNGYARRSAPSARWVARGGPVVVEFDRIMLPEGIKAGDRLEVYRTENVTPGTATPGAEYFLAIEYTVTDLDDFARYIEKGTLIDDVPDSLLGATLYTSPSQGGIGQSNEAPPLANSIAWWGDVMWYGNTTSRRTLPLEIVGVGDSNGTNDPHGVHARTGIVAWLLEGDFVSGSTVVANLDPNGGDHPHGLKAGQYVDDNSGGPLHAGTAIQELTKIASITSRLRVDNGTLADGDTVTIFGVTLTWRTIPSAANTIGIGVTSDVSAANLASAVNALNFDEPVDVTAIAAGATVTFTESRHGLAVCPVPTGLPTAQDVTYSLVMTKPATATTTRFFTAADAVTVNGLEFYGGFTGAHIAAPAFGHPDPADRQFGIDSSSSGVTPQDYRERLSNTAISLSRAINAYTLLVDPSFGIVAYRDVEDSDGALTLLRTRPELGPFSVQCTGRPEAFRPNLAEPVETDDTRARHRVYWSKPQEPEAVPLLNFLDIGSNDRDILALTPTRDALLVWKEDGLYRITGSAPDLWVVDDVDPTIRLVAPQATCVLDGICYALTDRGVVAVTAGGVQVVSGPIATEIRRYTQLLPRDQGGHKRAFWMVAHQRLGLVVLGVGSSASAGATEAQYVLHARAGGRWSRWPRADRCAAYVPAEDRMVVAPGVDGWALHYERAAEVDPASYYDASLSGISGTLVGDVLTVPGVSEVVSGTAYLINSNVLPGHTLIQLLDGAPAELPETGPYEILVAFGATSEIATVTARSGGQLTLTGPVAGSYPAGVATVSRLFPAAFGVFEPAQGDVVSTGLAAARIAAVSDDGTDWTLTLDPGHALASGPLTLTWYQAIACTIEWQAQHLPGHGSRWQEMHVALENDTIAVPLPTWPMAVGGTRAESPTPSTITAPVKPSGALYQAIRVGVPRALVRAYQMGPRIAITAAGVLWRVSELALHVTGQAQRVRR